MASIFNSTWHILVKPISRLVNLSIIPNICKSLNPYIFYPLMIQYNQNPKTQYITIKNMNNLSIPAQTLQEAWEKGVQQGLTQVAVNMLREGIDLDFIVKLTGLPLAVVKNLQTVDINDDKILVKEFLEISESSLNKVWLNSEEDEAWKDL
jgi:hypothetical protein